MSGREELAEQAARLVRQGIELGEAEWFLDRFDRDDVLRLARAASRGAAAGGQGRSEDAELRRPAADPARPSRMPADGPQAPPPTAGAPSAAPPGPVEPEQELPVLPDEHDALRDVALGCTRCGLSENRTQVVFSDGVPDARLMVVGEAPGANEDATGLPFVGAAGKFLDLLLATVDLSREESVYICNVLKCRPPGNRDPEPDEIETCSPYLLKQIDVVEPRAILAVGSFAAKLLTSHEKAALGKLRGEVHSYRGVPLVVTYHPAALLRNANWTRAFWDDLQLLRDVLDGPYLEDHDVR
ncbi:MAG: uracil-DNA glycosylase [Gemmatimonadota bacterium]|nr:uracil-DNA glycosylase [Gemmatimonadota bacterium]